jgi:hypothetical protein
VSAAATFTTSINRLLAQVSHWQQPRWSSAALGEPGEAAPRTRADVVFALVQRLADLGADAEHRDRRPVPREHDLILPDQLRVMSADLLTADPPDELLSEAAAATDNTRKAFP